MHFAPLRQSDSRWTLALPALLGLSVAACGSLSPGVRVGGAETRDPPVIASADFTTKDAAPVSAPGETPPPPLDGVWKVASGGRDCELTLSIDESELSGFARGCSDAVAQRPITIGLVSGRSFLFQSGRVGEGWIWSGRYDPEKNALVGRREHVVTGKVESFVARR